MKNRFGRHVAILSVAALWVLASCQPPDRGGDSDYGCDAGYHNNGSGTCVLDEECLPSTCMGHGACTVEGGVATCACFQGYAGNYCDACAQRYHWGQCAICLPDGNGIDDCPDDDQKTEPGFCGCGVPDDDTDCDGTPDCIDEDDDGDGWTDLNEIDCGTDPLDSSSVPTDANNDGICD